MRARRLLRRAHALGVPDLKANVFEKLLRFGDCKGKIEHLLHKQRGEALLAHFRREGRRAHGANLASLGCRAVRYTPCKD